MFLIKKYFTVLQNYFLYAVGKCLTKKVFQFAVWLIELREVLIRNRLGMSMMYAIRKSSASENSSFFKVQMLKNYFPIHILLINIINQEYVSTLVSGQCSEMRSFLYCFFIS